MTVSCLFSKWPEATALFEKTAIGVAEFLFHCFTRHGCCKVKITDQVREIDSKVPYKDPNLHVCYVLLRVMMNCADSLE